MEIGRIERSNVVTHYIILPLATLTEINCEFPETMLD